MSAHDKRLTGFRIPPTEETWRDIAARPLEDVPPFHEGGWRAMLVNNFRRTARVIVDRIDAVSAWENEGGR